MHPIVKKEKLDNWEIIKEHSNLTCEIGIVQMMDWNEVHSNVMGINHTYRKMEDRYTLIAHYFACGLQQKEIIAMMDIVHNYKLHPRTLKRILRELMLYRRKRFSPITHVVNFISDQLDKSGQLHDLKEYYADQKLVCSTSDLHNTQVVNVLGLEN
ncbi:hypothetical protein NQ315_004537 [Exocentrus adspersus]|uniref:Uncharacterized protein n=1 Tax=Exocentrus adspersus TaxID=1586481 RepID=A0AAV8V829_9CUCU|nr:hypothetical protein NQ315_004537 [Exocentrus adspersus]